MITSARSAYGTGNDADDNTTSKDGDEGEEDSGGIGVISRTLIKRKPKVVIATTPTPLASTHATKITMTTSSAQHLPLPSTSSLLSVSYSRVNDQAGGESDTTATTPQQTISGLASRSQIGSDFTPTSLFGFRDGSGHCGRAVCGSSSSVDAVQLLSDNDEEVEETPVELAMFFDENEEPGEGSTLQPPTITTTRRRLTSQHGNDAEEEIQLPQLPNVPLHCCNNDDDDERRSCNYDDGSTSLSLLMGVSTPPHASSLLLLSPPPHQHHCSTHHVPRLLLPTPTIITTNNSNNNVGDSQHRRVSTMSMTDSTTGDLHGDNKLCQEESSSYNSNFGIDRNDVVSFSFSSKHDTTELFSPSLHEELLGNVPNHHHQNDHHLCRNDDDDNKNSTSSSIMLEDSCGWLCLDGLVLDTTSTDLVLDTTSTDLHNIDPLRRYPSSSQDPHNRDNDTFRMSPTTRSSLPPTSATTVSRTSSLTSTQCEEDSCGWLVPVLKTNPLTQNKHHAAPIVTTTFTKETQLQHPELSNTQQTSSPHCVDIQHQEDEILGSVRTGIEKEKKKMLLAISLNGTIVHEEVGGELSLGRRSCDAVLTVSYHKGATTADNRHRAPQETIEIYYRPHIIHFITAISEYFDIAIFSTQEQDYVDALFDVMDPSGQVFPKSRRYYRQHCTKVTYQSSDCLHPTTPVNQGNCTKILSNLDVEARTTSLTKDLRRLGRPLQEVILVDNAAHSGNLQPRNLLLLPTWTGDPFDTTLIQLADYLVNVAKSTVAGSGVRQFLI